MNINLLITYYLHTSLRHAKYTPEIFLLRNTYPHNLWNIPALIAHT